MDPIKKIKNGFFLGFVWLGKTRKYQKKNLFSESNPDFSSWNLPSAASPAGNISGTHPNCDAVRYRWASSLPRYVSFCELDVANHSNFASESPWHFWFVAPAVSVPVGFSQRLPVDILHPVVSWRRAVTRIASAQYAQCSLAMLEEGRASSTIPSCSAESADICSDFNLPLVGAMKTLQYIWFCESWWLVQFPVDSFWLFSTISIHQYLPVALFSTMLENSVEGKSQCRYLIRNLTFNVRLASVGLFLKWWQV